MRTSCFVLVLSAMLFVPAQHLRAQGVMIVDAPSNELLDMDSSWISIDVQDQVAMVWSTQGFVNLGTDTVFPKYAYPLPETASAVRLRWLLNGMWNTASMVAQAPDTTMPGAGTGQGGQPTSPDLLAYLGETPLYFRILQGIPPGASIAVEITYVELLPYENARVELLTGADYSLVAASPLAQLSIDATVRSQRAITSIDLMGTGAWGPGTPETFVSADSAALHLSASNVPVDHPFSIGYDLDPLGYGLISMSNYLPDSLVKCDELGNGFFVLLIEPEPTSTVIAKDFVIVIDKSGSMSGSKLQEAKDAASYMVNNLNLGDLFNVITFESSANAWSSGLQPFNAATMSSALNWISQVQAGGGTNINTAITMGINNYITSVPDHARPLIFLTDGQASEPNAVILSNAAQLRQQIAPDLQLFTFGIGDGFNEQLLNQLAVQNNGVSQFLAMANFSQVMGDFYMQIQNPVLLAPVATFDHPDIQNIHPLPLMGLFAGQQLAIVGRYDEPGPVNLHLEGTASGQAVSFDYPITLTGEFDEDRTFIPKVWAQKAIAALLNEYYTYQTGSAQAQLLEDSIASYSMCYGITSPFTSFVDPGGGGWSIGVEEMEAGDNMVHLAYPDPSEVGAPVTFDLTRFQRGERLTVRIMDISGRLLIERDLSPMSGTTWIWDGLDSQGQALQGQLIYQLISGTELLAGRLTRL
jgi:Ca-activated chloride channel homolog